MEELCRYEWLAVNARTSTWPFRRELQRLPGGTKIVEHVIDRCGCGNAMRDSGRVTAVSYSNSNATEEIYFLWRPTLPDPSDDLVLEVAAHGRCDRIVTFNTRDFVDSERFGVKAETPGAFLRSLGIKL